MTYSIGVDIGGTKIAAGIVSRKGEIIEKKTISTPQGGKNEVISAVLYLIKTLLDYGKNNHLVEISGIGIGTAGQIDFDRGLVLSGTTNIADWNHVPLRELIEDYFHYPVWVDNDVNVVLLAENQLGCAIGVNDVICLALGTGVGGSVISGGNMIRGRMGAAAELGHITIDMNGPQCNCGFNGCLETYASGTGIARMMKEKLVEESVNEPIDIEKVTSHDVFKQYKGGDPKAKEVVNTMIRALTYGIVNCIHTFNPSLVILGGGVMQEGGWILQAVQDKISTIGLQSMIDPVKIRRASLGGDAGLIGAAYQSFVYKNNQSKGEEIEWKN